MKRISLCLLLLASMTFLSCKKSNDSTPATAASTWTFNGKTYNVTGAYLYSSNILFASDDAGVAGGGNYIKIIFGAITRPSASGTLTVVDIVAASNPSNCVIQVGNQYDATRPLGYI